MRVTIRDVAKRAQCSISTVSLVLNNKSERISLETKERVLKAVAELGYSPNQLVVSLVKQRSLSIGLVVPDISNQFFSKLIKAIENICQEYGFNIILCNTNDDPQLESSRIDVLLDKSVDGLLLCMASGSSYETEREKIQRITERHVPYCVIDRHYHGLGSYIVAVDHRLGGELATQALLNAGHKRIALLTGPLNLEDAQQRFSGYKNVLEKAGLDFDERLVFEGDYRWRKGYDAAIPIVESKATAVFASNDLSAIGLISGLQTLGVKIPEDLSIVGYDDSEYAEIYNVPFTSVHQPLDKLGREAFTLVHDQIEGKVREPSHILIRPHLVERSSIAAPKNN